MFCALSSYIDAESDYDIRLDMLADDWTEARAEDMLSSFEEEIKEEIKDSPHKFHQIKGCYVAVYWCSGPAAC